jgi:hypothetical protein
MMGYLVPGHYNFSKLEKRHYYSRILKFAITILDFPRICHGIRMKTTRAQLQVYTKTYISLYLGSHFNDTRDPLVSIIFFFLSSLTQPSLFPSFPSPAGHPLTCGRAPHRAVRRPLPFSASRAAAPAFALPLCPSLFARTGSLPSCCSLPQMGSWHRPPSSCEAALPPAAPSIGEVRDPRS